MIVFADTSGLFALLVRDDIMHVSAKNRFAHFALIGAQLLTSSYVLVETMALLQRRVGLAPVHDFNAKIFPLMEILWVDGIWHAHATQRLLREDNQKVSLVDCLSFEIMEAREITEAFTFDRHFAHQGFNTTPPSQT
jgi:predicted nucleic acid-binding protein